MEQLSSSAMLIRSSNEQTFFPVSIRVINSLEVLNEFASASCVLIKLHFPVPFCWVQGRTQESQGFIAAFRRNEIRVLKIHSKIQNVLLYPRP